MTSGLDSSTARPLGHGDTYDPAYKRNGQAEPHPLRLAGRFVLSHSSFRCGVPEEVLAMYTREEEGHVCRDPSGLVLEEDGAGVSSAT